MSLLTACSAAIRTGSLALERRRNEASKAESGLEASELLRAVIFGSYFALAVIFSYTRQENGMTSPHTNLYENASKASHYRRRHLVVAAAL